MAGTALARALLTPVIGDRLPFITLFPAVFFAAWYGGLGPSLLATVLSVGIAQQFFLPRLFGPNALTAVGIIGIVLFVATGITIGVMGESRLRAINRALEAAREASEAAA